MVHEKVHTNNPTRWSVTWVEPVSLLFHTVLLQLYARPYIDEFKQMSTNQKQELHIVAIFVN